LYTPVRFETKSDNAFITLDGARWTPATRPINKYLLVSASTLCDLHEIVLTAVCLFDIEALEVKNDLITHWRFHHVLAIEVRFVIVREGLVIDDAVS